MPDETKPGRQIIFPALFYKDARAAIEWLNEAFGFEPIAVYPEEGELVAHAELRYRGGVVMLGSADGHEEHDWLDRRPGTGSVYVVVDDPDAHFERARAAGAQILKGLTDEDYGSRGYTATDPEGNTWSFGTYAP
jgi:uncharacterized glyoxalase superfamily protein PhnB